MEYTNPSLRTDAQLLLRYDLTGPGTRHMLAAPDRGRFLLRIIAMCFDRYLAVNQASSTAKENALSAKEAHEARFSRVV